MTKAKINVSPSQRQFSAVERAALDWLALLDRGATPAQETEFEAWLAADPRHAQTFSEFDGTWTLLNRVQETPEAAAAAATGKIDPDAFAPTRGQFHRFPRVRTFSVSLLAAAAAITIAYLGWWPTHSTDGKSADYAGSVVTELGALRTVNLPDGSILQLNTDSAVNVQFTSAARRVHLVRGEVHFAVAKNPARPFVVNAAGVDVRAVGTAFNIRLRSEAVEVLVTEGKVRVNDEQGHNLLPLDSGTTTAKGSPNEGSAGSSGMASLGDDLRPLSAGEKIAIPLVLQSVATPASATPVIVPAAEIERTLAWQERRLEFVSVPLSEMIAEFNRYNRQKLVIADARLAEQRFGGTFRPNDLAGFVRMLEANFGIAAEQHGTETLLRLAP